MSEWVQKISTAIAERKLFSRKEQLLVAVSGGMDSMVLLHVLHELGRENGWRLTVAHFNHCLRGRSSDADERLVRKEAEALGLPIVVERGKVKEFARKEKLSIEMAARQMRHEFLAQVAAQRGCRKIALAHHADDQVELFFVRLLRGAGVEGLAGMKWKSVSPTGQGRGIELVRPLLGCTKEELRDFAGERKIQFREDATNASLDYLRNRIRHELLPLLQKKYQPAVRKTVLRLMEILRAEDEVVAERLEQITRRAKPVASKAKAFEAWPISLQRRWLQGQLHKMGLSVEFELVEYLRLTAGKPVCVGADLAVFRDAEGRIQLRRKTETIFNLRRKKVDLFGRHGIVLFDGLEIEWEHLAVKQGPQRAIKAEAGREVFDAERIGSLMVLRHWQPGDRFQPIGMPSGVKLQDLFTNLKIPQTERMERVVATSAQGEIFWVEGLRIGEGFKVLQTTTSLLQWRWQRG